MIAEIIGGVAGLVLGSIVVLIQNAGRRARRERGSDECFEAMLAAFVAGAKPACWDEWPDLSGAYLSGADLSGANLSGADLRPPLNLGGDQR